MHRRFTFILVLFVILTIIFPYGCASKKAQKPNETVKESVHKTPAKNGTTETSTEFKLGDFFPMKYDMRWSYQGVGNEYATFTRKVIYTSDHRAQFLDDNGGTVTESIFDITNQAIVRTYFTGEQYQVKNYLSYTPNDNEIILQAPLKEGTKWKNATNTREIVDISAITNTPAGEFFDCIKVKITDKNSTTYEYYKSGIGLVSREFKSSGGSVSSKLESYSQ